MLDYKQYNGNDLSSEVLVDIKFEIYSYNTSAYILSAMSLKILSVVKIT